MSVKPLCKSPQELGNFTGKEYKAKFLKSVKKLAKKHTSQETAAPFFLDTEAKLKDGAGFLLLFGKMNAWKKHAKDTAPKSEALRGYCFVTTAADGSLVLNLMPVAGKLKSKENIIQKELKKVIAVGKVQAAIVKGDFVDNDALEAAAEAMEETPDSADDDDETPETEASETAPSSATAPTAPAKEEASKAPMTAQELANNFKGIGEQFKTVHGGVHNADDVKALFKTVAKWQKHYELLDAGMKAKLAPHAEQMKKYMEGTQQMLRADHVLDGDIDKVVDIVTKFADNHDEGLKQQALALLKNIEKIGKSLNASDILEQVEELRGLLA